jgi:hypothetical protein
LYCIDCNITHQTAELMNTDSGLQNQISDAKVRKYNLVSLSFAILLCLLAQRERERERERSCFSGNVVQLRLNFTWQRGAGAGSQ